MSLNFTEIEKKWQKKWADAQAFKAEATSSKPKYYALDMFPYPSGSGLHIGHMASYTPGDIVSRYKRAKGFNVLHPMGYDAFGLPAEQYAIQTGIHPAITTEKAIESFRKTLQSFGFSFDWSREISTAEPKFYKWTQFIFLKLYERGLAYQKEVPVNWCPELKTVLANDEVIDGKSERGGHPVIRVPMKQWMLKITDYAERLLNDLDKVDWPERTKEAQRNWIGKSEGARVMFKVKDEADLSFEVFTTRPDTLFGVSFMVLAPEHPLVKRITTQPQHASVEDYVLATSRKSEVERKATTEKTGVFTGAHAINPVNGESVEIWIADYVLTDYGTGAIMAVPGHDARDHEFATKFNLPVKRVLEGGDTLPFEGDGKLVNSDFLNGLTKTEAISKMIAHLENAKLGTREVQYKLRDWLFSRQRYWGEPFPIVNLEGGKQMGVPYDELPVMLPEVADYEPSETGEAPLAKIHEWVNYKGKNGETGRRETDTMPGAAGSSWYFLRYIDPNNDAAPFDPQAEKYWMPVDLYVGGPEHTVGHLLYSRFWMKVLFDCGLVTHDEPFKKLAHQGMILGPDNQKMSKSRGNVISPDDVAKTHGADALRTFISFMGPLNADKPWSPTGIDGVKRFLDRVGRLVVSDDGNYVATKEALPPAIEKLLHKTIKKVTEDVESMSFNTAIAAMMILVNDLYKADCSSELVLKPLAQILAPFAPHMAEELWEKMGGEGLCSLAPWPSYDSNLCADDTVTIGVQVNGKMRGTIEIGVAASEEEALTAAKAVPGVNSALSGKDPDKVIYKAGKILNLIIKA
ncbi:leucine--tRNA ligase [Bdellovibrio sp. SKB1291214]|uniref:leucine--tRNA ligase n=1 Tax=Bdellovibrio sp. SKB1291214 TaxID=1732569 RepID=UPI000B519007|nr:leucine--tRNA ligase [Bdellovibrio sp. SKB1291214]UYL10237.1 leucine--tRNA ligase [Bdellovibrio sp. SKB1291214]